LRRDFVSLYSPAIAAEGELIAYGHLGRPVIAFPSEQGRPWDYEDRGMIDAIAWLLDEGRVKLYCVDSYDSATWFAQELPLEGRARRHHLYESWVVDQVVPWIRADCGGDHSGILVTGCSFGAYHAANFALRRGDLFPIAICQSGVYDVTVVGGDERGDAVYFNNPVDFLSNLHGDHLEWLRATVGIVLVCGQGRWEDTTGALESTRHFAGMLADKGVQHEMDLWGHDVAHDWPWWRAQLAHHLPRFC
jgi:esterase/lipase superfamily enzyme